MVIGEWKRALQVIPFIVVSVLSLWAAGRAPHGRKPFEFDLSISPDAVVRSMTKTPHFKSIAIIFVLAVVGVGAHRIALAFGLTMLVGFGWELAETTVVGHHARVADLAPDLVAGLACTIVAVGLRWVVVRVQARRSMGLAQPGSSA